MQPWNAIMKPVHHIKYQNVFWKMVFEAAFSNLLRYIPVVRFKKSVKGWN